MRDRAVTPRATRETAEPPLSPARAFVVQFRESPSPATAWFAGRVEHMVSGDAARFQSPGELLGFFARVLGAMPCHLSKEESDDPSI